MKPGEESEVFDLIFRTFSEFIAPHYSRAGILAFLKYIRPGSLLERLQKEHFVLLAIAQRKIIGIIEVRGNRHISLLFVDKQFQKMEIAKELLRRTLRICMKEKPDLSKITVNASPNSVEIYKRLGFRPVGSEQVKKGIRYTPMTLELSKAKVLTGKRP
jgi:ribosomal protein S18 acetylase RimI-like enzyme